MPIDAKIRCVQVNNGIPCLWVEGWDENPTELRIIAIYSTDEPIPTVFQGDDYIRSEYIGTVQLESGNKEYHVHEVLFYEKREKKRAISRLLEEEINGRESSPEK